MRHRELAFASVMASAIPLPPSYELPRANASDNIDARIDDTLPDYTPRTSTRAARPVQEKEFEYKVERKKGETLASLKVVAPAAYSQNIPTFCGTGPVKGSVNLYLKDPETITSVSISIRGIFNGGQSDESMKMFEIPQELWSKDADEASETRLLSNKKKLSGTHSWAFAIPMPEKVQYAGDNATGPMECTMPQTFNEKVVRASIRYEVVARIGRGKLKTDYKIPTAFGYIPLIRPPPFLPLKSIAYQEGTPLLDPTIDVEGWTPADETNISATLFNSRPAEVACQLFISAPLVYTRGSVIPLYLRLRSGDQQALDLLATQKAISVRLQRKIRYYLPMKNLKNPENINTSRGKDVRDLAEAVWWPAPSEGQGRSSSGTSEEHTVCINGEIHLRADLVPSSIFAPFTIEYRVVMRTIETPGLKVPNAGQSLLEHPVDIVTSFAPGPRAVRSAPPGYDSDKPLTKEHGVALQGINTFL